MNKYLLESLEVLDGLEKAHVEYMIIGGVAVNIHGFQRATGDLDIWYNPTTDNFNRLLACLKHLGYDISDFQKSNKTLAETIIRIPLEFFYIELLPFLDGKTTFATVYHRAGFVAVEGRHVRVISYDDLIVCKANVHRAKDLEDIAQLEKRRQNDKED
jgi:predicted nucleotidyltransferase